MMNKKYTHSLLVYVKKKYTYGKREEQLQVLADGLGGKFIGGGTDLSTKKRDQQYYFKSIDDVRTFLDYPTVKEAILSEVDIVNVKGDL